MALTILAPCGIEIDTGYMLLKRGIIAIRPATKPVDLSNLGSVAPVNPDNCIVTMEGGRDYYVGLPVADVLLWYRSGP